MKNSEKILISILIPCHNEQEMISACVDSCLSQTRKPDQIVVVNDGSTDGSFNILEKYSGSIEIVNIPIATGNKSKAQEIGLEKITGDIVIMTDGDTILDKNFVKIVEKEFIADSKLMVVAGCVQSVKYNFITALREIDYIFGQDLYKLAQSYAGFILVIPGCAGVFRTKIFKDKIIKFDHTLTEDLDLTYKLHLLDIKIKFSKKAIVYTQDPPNLRSYINQMRRWYGGGWQNLTKHYKIIGKKYGASLILSFAYIESIAISFVLLVLPFISLYKFIQISFWYFMFGILISVYAAIKRRRVDLLLAGPFVSILTIINAYVFVEQFIKEIIFQKRERVWFKPDRTSIINLNQ